MRAVVCRRRRAALALLCAAGLGAPAALGREPTPEALARARALTARAAGALAAARTAEALELTTDALALLPDSRNARRNAALAWATRGAEALAREAAPAARAGYEQALELHPERLAYRLGRARALLLLGGLGEAEREARDALRLDPDHVDAWRLLGDTLERAGRLEEAAAALGEVLERGVDDDALGRRVTVLGRRARAEARYLDHSTGHFEARYDPDLPPQAVGLALTLLEDAYARVTAELGLTPRTPARVVLYPDEEFRAVTGAHSWVGAVYGAGVLRVPMRNLERHRETARRVLAHEYTHHLLYERAPGLPSWWHEAIAQWMEHGDGAPRAARETEERLAAALARGRLLSLEELRSMRSLAISDPGVAQLYYAQGLAFLGWLHEEHGGGGRLTAFLLAFAERPDAEAAAQTAWGASESALYARWAARLGR